MALPFSRVSFAHPITAYVDWMPGLLDPANTKALVAAQAHSAKQDRAVVISSRNFLRALGGAGGLAIASALFSNTLIGHLDATSAIPRDVADEIKSSVFSMPNISKLTDDQKISVLDTYTRASRSVFYFWEGCIGLCWLLMFFIKDEGLQRKEGTQAYDAAERRRADGTSGSTTTLGDDRTPVQHEEKSDDLAAAPEDEPSKVVRSAVQR